MGTRTVLVTGSATGIGKATVEEFAKAGWRVAATSRHPDSKLFEVWPNVRVYDLDVTNKRSIEVAFTAVSREFKTIDVVVNNAGYGLDGIFEEITEAQIRSQFETNVFGLMNVTREAIKVMRPAKGGTIIQVASMGGRLAFPLYSVYHASKWAVEGFSESLRYELEQFNVRIKIIEPGVINTAFYGNSRVGVESSRGLGYNDFARRVKKFSQDSGAKGEPPQLVAKTILKAANDASRKLRYIVGAPAPILLSLRKVLPGRAYYWLVRKIYHI